MHHHIFVKARGGLDILEYTMCNNFGGRHIRNPVKITKGLILRAVISGLWLKCYVFSGLPFPFTFLLSAYDHSVGGYRWDYPCKK